jgi:hypothetical protein
MQTSQAAANAGLTAIDARLNGGSLNFYSGVAPATPETTLSGNTLLVSCTFSATAFGAGSFSGGFEVQPAAFTSTGFAPAASGTAVFALGVDSNGTTYDEIYTIVAPWVASIPSVLGQLVSAGGNTYKCTTEGTNSTVAPSGTTTFTDGSTVWTYVGAGNLGDIVMGSSQIVTGTNLDVSSFTMKMPAS